MDYDLCAAMCMDYDLCTDVCIIYHKVAADINPYCVCW